MKTSLKFSQMCPEKVVPVVVIDDAAQAVPLALALQRAEFHTIEITLRTKAAIDAIGRIANETDLHIGAGTVLSVEQAKSAVDAGAGFLVSPGTNPKVVEYCVENEILILPGVCSPSEVELAASFGLDTLKFFPAEAAGGVSFLKAISAPYGDMFFVPTGGINADNFEYYTKLPSVLACGSSWVVDKKLIASSDWDEVERRCRKMKSIAETVS